MPRYERIVSLSPAITEILFMIGLGEYVIGDSAFCVRPDKARRIRKVGSYGTVRMEILEEIDPDVIFTISGFPHNLSTLLSEKFNVKELKLPSNVAGILNLVMEVGYETDAVEEARELYRNLVEQIGKINYKVGTVYIELDLGGPVSFGAYSYITDALYLKGLNSIYQGERREWLTPDFSYVKKMDPDIIIFEPKMFRSIDEDKIVNERGWSDLKAVKNDNVFVTPGNYDFFAHHGPSFITEVLPWIDTIIEKSKNK
ncbi:hypothetical protein [Thermoplasma volcanium GSS1]|uniref:Fe/B12 periplasmic-binding domain-containing protein n=1 Tax=Thermoplasma volcanium (strain ATCC 51530 / DSM 4299 / JCM 9571 / NBRC 15438 / GSS1) TaxID=273116 RepID=Q979T4_THEVO|nr:ABC transporter substrate-binding protein [Thermoplasma volcanium]BAB60218.1 hypothetical protein [Thermoplasma volcanium GSS1]